MLVPVAMYYVLTFNGFVCFAPLLKFLFVLQMSQTICRRIHASDVVEVVDIVCHNLNVLIVVMSLIYTANVRINLHKCKYLRQ